MKLKETMSNTLPDNNNDHVATSYDTPLRDDAFEKSNEEKIKIISHKFRKSQRAELRVSIEQFL